jgi:hypothetical protein
MNDGGTRTARPKANRMGAGEKALSLLLDRRGFCGFGDFRVCVPDQALNDLRAVRHVRVGAAQVVQLLQRIDIESDGNNVFHFGAVL